MALKEMTPAAMTAPPFARVPVLAVAGLLAVVLGVTSLRYGYFGDELYFLSAGKHLAWGYVDQPPMLPLLARAMDTIAPGSTFVLRLPATLAMAAGAVFTALIARELGGKAKAQTVAAAAFAVTSQFVGSGHYLATSTIDPFLWTVLLWLVVRWVRTRADGLLVWAGVVTALALYTKFLIGGFWLAAGIALLVVGPRDLLRRPRLWLGAAIAVAALVPTVLWQASHGWPQLRMGTLIAREVDQYYGGRLLFLPEALLYAGIPVGAVLVCYGLVRLLRAPELKPYRFLGWTTLGVTALMLAMDGRCYYVAGMFGLLYAVAAVELERGRAARWWRWITSPPVFALAAVYVVMTGLPVWPQAWLTEHPSLPRTPFASAEYGWQEGTASIEAAYAGVPDPAHTVIMTESYWTASALDYYGHGPAPTSPSRGYSTIATPADSATNVLYVGEDPRPLLSEFTALRPLGKVHAAAGSYLDGQPLWLATGRTRPWPVLWPELVDRSS